MEENENKNLRGDSIIPPIGEKWFTEFDDDEDEEEEEKPELPHRRLKRPLRKKELPKEFFDDSPVISQSKPEPGITEASERKRKPESDMRKAFEQKKKPEPEKVEAPKPEKKPEPIERREKKEHIEYMAREGNLGAAFTLRTNDDSDPDKQKSRQDEFETAEDADSIRESILRLKNSLLVRAAVLLFASLFSLFISIANDLEQPMAAVFDRTVNPSAYIFTNTILGIAAVGFSYSTVVNGIKSLFKLSPDSDTLIALNLISAIIAGLATLFDPEPLKLGYFHIYTSFAITLLFLSTLAKLGVVRRTLSAFEFMTESDELAAVQQAEENEFEDLRTRRKSIFAYLRQTNFVKDLMKNSYSSDLSDLFSEKAAPLMLIAALVVGGLSWICDSHATNSHEKLFVLLSAISGTLSICSAASLVMISNYPLARAAKKLLNCSAVIAGYSAVEENADIDTVIIDAAELFLGDSVSIEEIKMLSSGITEEKALVYAASLARVGRSVTAPVLEELAGGESELVSGCVSEASMGIFGWIDSKRMILGGRSLLQRYNVIGLPTDAQEQRFAKRNRVVYLSVSGKAVMMFTVSLNVDRVTRKQIQALEDDHVMINLRSCDSFIKQDDIAMLFDIKQSTAAILPLSCEDEYDIITEPADSLSASMFCKCDAGAFAMLLIAAKRIRYASNIGVAVQYGAMFLGITISVVLMIMDSFSQITPTVVFAYSVIFMIIMKILQDIKRL